MNKITVNFNTCSPSPSGGYNIHYRVVDSHDAYTNAGNFFISPAVFYDTLNPIGTCYEGYIRTDCGVLGDPVFFNSCESGEPIPTTATINWDYENLVVSGGHLRILVNGFLTIDRIISDSGSLIVNVGDVVTFFVNTTLTGTALIDIDGPYVSVTSTNHVASDEFTAVVGTYTIFTRSSS